MTTLPSILEKTQHFIHLYMYYCGRADIPNDFNWWACASLIAATVEDRVWVEIYDGKPLYPNLYVMLIAPGAVGKGMAIGNAFDLVEESIETYGFDTNRYRGRITSAGLVDLLGGRVESGDNFMRLEHSKLWLLMDELRNDIQAGGHYMTEDFFTMMTELYTGQYRFQTGTRTTGFVDVNKACVNWLCGTTKDWLLKVLTRDMAYSGFTDRLVVVFADALRQDLPRPIYPHDRALVYEVLKARLFELSRIYGKFQVTDEALGKEAQWYANRTMPEESALQGAYRRQQALMYKIAMILALAERGPLVIREHHVNYAINAVKHLLFNTATLLDIAGASKESADVDRIEMIIRRAENREIGHSALMRKVSKWANARLVKDCMRVLVESDRVEMAAVGKRGGMGYRWVG